MKNKICNLLLQCTDSTFHWALNKFYFLEWIYVSKQPCIALQASITAADCPLLNQGDKSERPHLLFSLWLPSQGKSLHLFLLTKNYEKARLPPFHVNSIIDLLGVGGMRSLSASKFTETEEDVEAIIYKSRSEEHQAYMGGIPESPSPNSLPYQESRRETFCLSPKHQTMLTYMNKHWWHSHLSMKLNSVKDAIFSLWAKLLLCFEVK